jgi:hypothetical protein
MRCLKHHRFKADSRRTVLLFRLSSGVGSERSGGRSGGRSGAAKTPAKTPRVRASRALVRAREARTVLLTRDSASGRETNRWCMSDVIGCELVGGETVAIHTRSTTGAERRMQFTPAEEGALRRCTSAAVLANALRCVGARGAMLARARASCAPPSFPLRAPR